MAATFTTADLSTTSDHTALLSRAISSGGFPNGESISLPQGSIHVYGELPKQGQGCILRGVGAVAGGTEIVYYGPAGTHLLQNLFPEQSVMGFEGIRLRDGRVPADQGRLVNYVQGRNEIRIKDYVLISSRPDACYIGADAGKCSDCLIMEYGWLSGGAGVVIERLMKTGVIRRCHSDSRGDTPMFTVQNIAPDSCVLIFEGIGQEQHSTAPMLRLKGHTYGNVTLRDAVQLCPTGIASDIVVMDTLHQSRLTLANVTGAKHAGPTGAGIVSVLDTGKRIYGPIGASTAIA